MSLIPSESLNFPDSFRANVGWHLSEQDAKPKPRTRRPTTNVVEEPTSAEPPQKTQLTAKPNRSPNAEHSPAPAASSPNKVKTAIELEPEPASDATVAPAGPILTGNDAAAFLSKIFISAGAAAASVEAVNGEAAPTNPASAMPLADADCAAPLHALAAAASEKLGSAPKLTIEPAMEDTTLSSIPTAEPAASEDGPVENGSTPPSSAHVESTAAPTAALAVENPAQTQHIFELIAAAVERGTLAGSSISAPAAEPAEAMPLPSESVPASPAATTSSGPAHIEPLIAQAMAAPAPSTAPKTPAKIRIQPRKIKPRSAASPSPQPLVTSDQGSFNAAALEPAIEKMPIPAQMPLQPETRGPKPEQPMPRLDYRELAARNIPAATGLEMTRSERRNRWIGFGLSEAAALTSLVLLGGYGFTHKFPDSTMKLLIFILMFAAAAISVALPIAFIRNSPARWQKRALNYRRDTPAATS